MTNGTGRIIEFKIKKDYNYVKRKRKKIKSMKVKIKQNYFKNFKIKIEQFDIKREILWKMTGLMSIY